ncbi:hypothetical protein COB21_06115 [Candidatus Aerophobetes bacterium]|uniref:Uncharacterized protein n=1 Tax=Aerophobetes bacterium TaxID=2030807 RepID=A0A2A4WXT6_UNCAE|nr:MAG: hypothetical protein COB21_06115 [Candidatus Aerophobetes bacterium]
MSAVNRAASSAAASLSPTALRAEMTKLQGTVDKFTHLLQDKFSKNKGMAAQLSGAISTLKGKISTIQTSLASIEAKTAGSESAASGVESKKIGLAAGLQLRGAWQKIKQNVIQGALAGASKADYFAAQYPIVEFLDELEQVYGVDSQAALKRGENPFHAFKKCIPSGELERLYDEVLSGGDSRMTFAQFEAMIDDAFVKTTDEMDTVDKFAEAIGDVWQAIKAPLQNDDQLHAMSKAVDVLIEQRISPLAFFQGLEEIVTQALSGEFGELNPIQTNKLVTVMVALFEETKLQDEVEAKMDPNAHLSQWRATKIAEKLPETKPLAEQLTVEVKNAVKEGMSRIKQLAIGLADSKVTAQVVRIDSEIAMLVVRARHTGVDTSDLGVGDVEIPAEMETKTPNMFQKLLWRTKQSFRLMQNQKQVEGVTLPIRARLRQLIEQREELVGTGE